MLPCPDRKPLLLRTPFDVSKVPDSQYKILAQGEDEPILLHDLDGPFRPHAHNHRYHRLELLTPKLSHLKAHLWLAGLPRLPRPLHRQRLLGRKVVITESPDEHLVWHEDRIFLKPLPIFLFAGKHWEDEINHDSALHEAAMGTLLSYACLVSRRCDFDIAKEYKLLPESMRFEFWSDFIGDFLGHIDLQTLRQVSSRYQYGELRQSRLNLLYRLTTAGDVFMHGSTWYKAFFIQHFGWLLAVFAFFNVALSAMQVALQTGHGGGFPEAAWVFALVSLGAVGVSLGAVAGVWFVLFWWHLLRTLFFWKRVMRKRLGFEPLKSV